MPETLDTTDNGADASNAPAWVLGDGDYNELVNAKNALQHLVREFEANEYLWEAVGALEDLREQLAGGATRSGVSKEQVWERVAEAYAVDDARATLEASGHSRHGYDSPRDRFSERVDRTEDGDRNE